jgi:hypothetical protein
MLGSLDSLGELFEFPNWSTHVFQIISLRFYVHQPNLRRCLFVAIETHYCRNNDTEYFVLQVRTCYSCHHRLAVSESDHLLTRLNLLLFVFR